MHSKVCMRLIAQQAGQCTNGVSSIVVHKSGRAMERQVLVLSISVTLRSREDRTDRALSNQTCWGTTRTKLAARIAQHHHPRLDVRYRNTIDLNVSKF